MPLQDLTPQLRTRLSRLESAVGWFVILAALLLVTGFVYYVWHTAQRKGWFQEKILLSTFVNTATGIKPGDPVKMMGFPVGEVIKVVPNDPNFLYGNVTVFFQIRRDANNYCGYIWSDSKVRVAAADFLGNRSLELIKGQKGIPLLRMVEPQNDPRSKIIGRLNHVELKKMTALATRIVMEDKIHTLPVEVEITNVLHAIQTNPWDYGGQTYMDSPESLVALVIQALNRAKPERFYQEYHLAKDVFIEPDESPALTERMERVVSQAEKALPNILNLTNQITLVLSNAARLADHLDDVVADARPVVTNAGVLIANLDQSVRELKPTLTNVAAITTQLRAPKGSLGDWLIPTNLNQELLATLSNANATLKTANTTLASTDTNLTGLVENLHRTLDNLAGITSNLNVQVQANTNILSDISILVRDTDILVQGLRRHWLLRSAFKTNAPPKSPSPKPPANPPRNF